jgi:hypothetical protein
VKIAQPGQNVVYPNVDSCITLTAVLADNRKIVAHAVAKPNHETKMRSVQDILKDMKCRIGSTEVS